MQTQNSPLPKIHKVTRSSFIFINVRLVRINTSVPHQVTTANESEFRSHDARCVDHTVIYLGFGASQTFELSHMSCQV